MPSGDKSPSKATGTITLRMVADEAGVSAPTASRILNTAPEGRRKWASEATISRVLVAAESLGYRPDYAAASLRTKRTQIVGVLVPQLQDFVLATLYEAIDHAAGDAGLMSMVTNSFDDQLLREDRVERLLERRVDGLVLCDAQLDDPLLARLKERKVPFVLAHRRARAEYPYVGVDDFHGGALVARHFIEQGRRRLAVIAGRAGISTTEQRLAGFVASAQQLGVEVTPEDIVYAGFDAAEGGRGMRELLSRRTHDAVFAMNDFAAIGALAPLRERGLRVPDDVAIVGYNDTLLGASMTTPLTSVRSPITEVGLHAFAMLMDAQAGREPISLVLQPQLVVRGSSQVS